MLFAALAFAVLPVVADPPVYHGRQRHLEIPSVRSALQIVVDGHLDEPVWKQAAVLTGFSRYAPTDGVAADDSTEVLVWYSATAIHFGIRAFAEPGTVNATLADRDKIYNDDYVGIFLSTFNDGRQATVFAVNPFGVQGDGMLVERGASSSGFGGMSVGRESTDILPDFVFQSKGRLTDYGYEVEVTIPFKSLRYQAAATQSWGINIMRRVQSRGYEYSWAPAQRASASYVAQFGSLRGLTELNHGTVFDVNPSVSARSVGGVNTAGQYAYASSSDIGANVRWGITNNWTLNGTANPDFAEVESDAGQAVNDPRQALFFSEKRPFFLEGNEQFAVPNGLIYTRRIADPAAALKLTGKASGTSVAFLSAVDGRDVSATGDDHPLYNILRVQRDLGRSSRVGMVFTDRREPTRSNDVAAADVRLVWRKQYSALLQAGMSTTEHDGAATRTGSVFLADVRRSGKKFGARWFLNALDNDFITQTGFISRPAVAHALLDHSYTLYGRENTFIRSFTADVVLDGTWDYQQFVHGRDMIEKKLHFNNNVVLAGGWQAGASVLVEKFGFDHSLYSDLFVARPGTTDTVPFTGTPWLSNLDYVITVATPSFKRVSSNLMYIWGRDENFFEWSPSDIGWISYGLNWRPTDQFRVTGSYNWQGYRRHTDGTYAGQTRIPRLKLEYQLTRSIFVRAVGEYRADYADDLVDDSRTGGDVFRNVGGRLVRARGFSTVEARPKSINQFRPEVLFSYVPSPGTVVYAGYGGTLLEPESFEFNSRALARVRDSYFIKLSYLFRH